jgi:predicted ATPase
MVAQFLRIASESALDLRETGIPDDIAAVVERAMSRDPGDRRSAASLGEEIQRLQRRLGFTVDEMVLRPEPEAERPEARVVALGARRLISNLPLELTSFVGRRAELSEVNGLLSASRLVTLTGIGGVGKTRLALRAATEARRTFPDGLWLVELGDLRDGSLLVDVVAESLGVRDESGQPLGEVLIDFLCSRKLLLVLDNCEQVVEGAAKLAETLLRACPELRILATSREALGIGGEAVLRLSPLPFPEADAQPTLSNLPTFDAVTLFAERAAATVPDFELTDDDMVTVARICAKLDGLPLAIELAAARLRTISPEQILERLTDRYTLLTRGSRAAPTRQQTLSWSVGWSYDLCTPAEQRLWAQLSVFAGSFELEAAEDICDGHLTPDEFLDLLTALVDKSILLRAQSNGGIRFRLLETLRDYGRDQIQGTDDYLELRRRHRDWYRRLVGDAGADWFSSRQVEWLQRLDREAANLREALRFSMTDSPETALEITGTLHPFGIAHGHLSETRRWLDRTLAAALPEPTIERIRALYGATKIAAIQGDLPAATALVAEGQTLDIPGAELSSDCWHAVCPGCVFVVEGVVA